MNENKLPLESALYIHFSNLPVNKDIQMPCTGEINKKVCYIFRKKANSAIFNYLIHKYPQMCCLKADKKYTPSIIDYFINNKMAYNFSIDYNGRKKEMIAFLDVPLWDSASDDFYYLANLISYSEDYNTSGYPGSVFMDDYDLC